MALPGLVDTVVDPAVRRKAAAHLGARGIRLPRLQDLAHPERIDAQTWAALEGVDPDAPDARNLFRVHWYNDASRRRRAAVPEHVVLPRTLTELEGIDGIDVIDETGERLALPATMEPIMICPHACSMAQVISQP